MILYAHRINSVVEMLSLPRNMGAEIDVRDFMGSLVASHDPYIGGDQLIDVLEVSINRPLILNIKSEGIEEDVIKVLKKRNITNYFILDCTFPAIVKLINKNFTKIALRFSEYEGLDTLVNMQSKAEWVWVDCFTKLPFDKGNYTKIRSLGYKVCIVSPDLLNRTEEIEQVGNWLKINNFIPDAVCVKYKFQDKWAPIFS